jgi:hypothetical protein
MDLGLEPGKLVDLPQDIYAVVRGNRIYIVGPTITYREVDMSDGQEKWIDDLNVRNSLYYLHVGVLTEERALDIKIHEWVMHDGQKHLSGAEPYKVELRDPEEHDKNQVKAVTAGPPVMPKEPAPTPAPVTTEQAPPPPPTVTTDKPLELLYDVPEPTGDKVEHVKQLAVSVKNKLKVAQAMVNAMEEGDDDYIEWKQVCNLLAKPKTHNKYYVSLKNSKFRGKTLDGQVLIEIADFLESLESD